MELRFNLLNYALGLTRISLPHYVVATAICMVPGAIAFTWLGHAGRAAMEGDTAAIHYGLLGLAALAGVAFVPRLVRRIRGQREEWISRHELRRLLIEGDYSARRKGDCTLSTFDVQWESWMSCRIFVV